MVKQTGPLHEWLRPRVQAMLREAEAAGFAPDAAEAVLIDLVTGSGLNTVALPEEPPAPGGPAPEPAERPVEVDAEIGERMPNLLGPHAY